MLILHVPTFSLVILCNVACVTLLVKGSGVFVLGMQL